MYQILAGSPVARVMVQLPTGGGKTCIAGELLSGCLNGGRKAVWLTHRRELATQTEGMLHEAGVTATANMQWTPRTSWHAASTSTGGRTSSPSATAGPARPTWPSAGARRLPEGAVGRLHHRRLAGQRAERGQGRATAAQPPEEAGTAQTAHHRRAWLRPTLQDRRGAPLRGLQPDTREGRSWSPPTCPSTSGPRSSALRG